MLQMVPLELIGGITIGSGEDLTIIGDGMSDGNYLGALRNVSGTNTYQGSITLSTQQVELFLLMEH